MPTPRKRRRYPTAAPPRLSRAALRTGAFGVVRTSDGAWYWWAAWVDGRDPSACLGRDPDGTGWVPVPTPAQSLLGVLVALAFDTTSERHLAEPSEFLRAHGCGYANREDALAANAYHRAGRPAPPVVAASGGPPVAATPGAAPGWVAVLGCAWPDPSTDEVVRAYREAAKRAHPDKGGSDAAFQRVERAYRMAQGWLAEREERGG